VQKGFGKLSRPFDKLRANGGGGAQRGE